MIESLFNPGEIREKASKRCEVFLAGIIFSIVGILFAVSVVPPEAGAIGIGFLIVAFICIPAAPFFVQLFKIEEKEEIRKEDKLFSKTLLTHHFDIIEIFVFFFLGVLVTSSFVYVIVPSGTSRRMFDDQARDLEAKGVITGQATEAVESPGMLTGEVESRGENPGEFGVGFTFGEILANNLTVLALAFIFSFALGAGAVFLISWNASIIGVLVGKIAENPEMLGLADTGNVVTNYLVALPVTLLRLLPHGIFEFGAYFIGAIAGGILSAGVIQESVKGRKTKFKHLSQVIVDSGIYLIIAFILVIIGAAIEVAV